MQEMDVAADYSYLADLSWYALHVRSKHEFIVTRRLEGLGIKSFVPTVEKQRQWKDRKKLVTFPLFPGYVFVGIGNFNRDRLAALKTPGAVRFIGQSAAEPESVPIDQLIALMKLTASKEKIDPYPYLRQGMKVRINSGPMKGVEGTLVERKGIHLLILTIDILKQSVSVQIEASIVESL